MKVPATKIVRRLADGTYWTPAGDTPYPFHGFNFVPAIQNGRKWVKDMKGERWITFYSSEFEILRCSPPTERLR
jgi:hypothetical protein